MEYIYVYIENKEVAIGTTDVSTNKEASANNETGAAVQNTCTENIKTFGKSNVETHPDLCTEDYPNTSKFLNNSKK